MKKFVFFLVLSLSFIKETLSSEKAFCEGELNLDDRSQLIHKAEELNKSIGQKLEYYSKHAKDKEYFIRFRIKCEELTSKIDQLAHDSNIKDCSEIKSYLEKFYDWIANNTDEENSAPFALYSIEMIITGNNYFYEQHLSKMNKTITMKEVSELDLFSFFGKILNKLREYSNFLERRSNEDSSKFSQYFYTPSCYLSYSRYYKKNKLCIYNGNEEVHTLAMKIFHDLTTAGIVMKSCNDDDFPNKDKRKIIWDIPKYSFSLIIGDPSYKKKTESPAGSVEKAEYTWINERPENNLAVLAQSTPIHSFPEGIPFNSAPIFEIKNASDYPTQIFSILEKQYEWLMSSRRISDDIRSFGNAIKDAKKFFSTFKTMDEVKEKFKTEDFPALTHLFLPNNEGNMLDIITAKN